MNMNYKGFKIEKSGNRYKICRRGNDPFFNSTIEECKNTVDEITVLEDYLDWTGSENAIINKLLILKFAKGDRYKKTD